MYKNNFIEQLQRIIFEIRRLDQELISEKHMKVNNELTAWSVNYRATKENDIATTLFNLVKAYALQVSQTIE